jgi:glycosyltransferase involved in cell wall biosynthesis
MPSPYVTIGMPVYNGERFLEHAIETTLTQDFGDFELIISDNASTDATEEICRSYVAADPRIRYERLPQNRGAAWNFGNVLVRADPGTRYFKWSAADDEHAPAYLSTVVSMLDRDPSIALAHCRTADIDEDGHVLKVWDQPVSRLSSSDPGERLRDLLTLRHECFGAFGVIRHDIARSIRGLGPYSDADNVLLAEIALRGRIEHAPDVLFFRRQHDQRSVTAFPSSRDREAWFDSDRRRHVSFPVWRVGKEFLTAIEEAPLPSKQRRRCIRAMTTFLRHNWIGLVKNLVRSSVEASSSIRHRPHELSGPAESEPEQLWEGSLPA